MLHDYVEIFAWSYEDMLGLDTDIVVHQLPTKDYCPLVKQKVRRIRPEMSEKIKPEVMRQFDAGFLAVTSYPQWLPMSFRYLRRTVRYGCVWTTEI